MTAQQLVFAALIGLAIYGTIASQSSAAWVAGSVLAETLVLLLIVRALRMDLRIDDETVLVRNLAWTTHIRWAQVSAIGWRDVAVLLSGYGFVGRPAVAFACAGERRVAIAAATALLTEAERERLVIYLDAVARTNGIPIALASDDLRGYWLRPPQKEHEPLRAAPAG